MKRVFILFLSFLASLCFLDGLVSCLIKPVLLNEPDAGGNHSNFKWSLFDKKADIIVLGASKANHHYITDSLESCFGMTVFNGGVDGDNIVTSRTQFDAMCDRQIPKIVIIDLSGGQMAGNWESVFLKHKSYFGIEKHYTSVSKEFISTESRLKLYSSLYKINEDLLDIVSSYVKGNRSNNGFIPLIGTNSNLSHITKDNMPSYEMGEVQRRNLDHIVGYCKQNEIKLFIAYSPTLITYTNGVTETFKSYCSDHELPFFCYEGDSTFVNHPEYFKDYNHLNLLGARVYTSDIITKILGNLEKREYY